MCMCVWFVCLIIVPRFVMMMNSIRYFINCFDAFCRRFHCRHAVGKSVWKSHRWFPFGRWWFELINDTQWREYFECMDLCVNFLHPKQKIKIKIKIEWNLFFFFFVLKCEMNIIVDVTPTLINKNRWNT